MIDEQINIALETRDNLVNQREILKVIIYLKLTAPLSPLHQNLIDCHGIEYDHNDSF